MGELRLLQQLQLEINRRTTELETARVKTGDFSPEQLAELQELAEEQGKVAEIVLNLIQKKSENGDEPEKPAKAERPGEKKPGNSLDDELLKDLK